MPTWSEILNDIKQNRKNIDDVRRGFIKSLSEYTGRNTIIYYSAFLTKQHQNVDINDTDMNGFMETVHNLERDKGLDLILHTPGGNPVATESIVNYLKDIFNSDIRVIVPHMAMSAGTMLACASKEIVMGYHSSLGPIDPQFGGIPAFNIKKEFEEAQEQLTKDSKSYFYWKILLDKYNKADYKTVINAIDLSGILVKEWLSKCMLKDEENKDELINNIVNKLNENQDSKFHARHFNHTWCKNVGLKIKNLEDDQTLQDLVLSIHHSVNLTFEISSAVKIIENNNGKTLISSMPIIQPQKKNA
ncbi:MAG: serine protease [Acholeplasma sp.]|jgi:hypothetical protein|nr:MAG: serine protease [Acholeplasma sp.]